MRKERQEQLGRIIKIINELRDEASSVDEPRLKAEMLRVVESLDSFRGLFERCYEEMKVVVIPEDKVGDIFKL